MLGQRDANYRCEIGVASIADRVSLHAADDLRRDPERMATQAAAQVAGRASGWWLHVDLDVLDGEEFRACGAASDPSMTDGLTWAEPTEITRSILKPKAAGGGASASTTPISIPTGQTHDGSSPIQPRLRATAALRGPGSDGSGACHRKRRPTTWPGPVQTVSFASALRHCDAHPRSAGRAALVAHFDTVDDGGWSSQTPRCP
jgi:hypothetical protein